VDSATRQVNKNLIAFHLLSTIVKETLRAQYMASFCTRRRSYGTQERNTERESHLHTRVRAHTEV